MRKITKIILGVIAAVFVIIVILAMFGEEKPQITTGTWTKCSQNPVIKGDLSHSWMQLIGDPSVLKDGSVYRIWFGAHILDGITQIGYATSPDGIDWDVHPQPVMKAGPAGSWDALNTETPVVIKNSDGIYEMWYAGTGAEPGEPVAWNMLHKIGHATSPDGIVWTKDPTPALDMTRDTPVSLLTSDDLKIWNVLGVADPTVLKEGDTYKMWHTGAGLKDGKMIQQIGYSTSKDGINWEQYKKNPVLPLGKKGSWDSFSVAQPSVFHDGKRYVMLYTGTDKEFGDESSGDIGVAFSEDGVNWERYDKAILKKGKSAAEWDGRGIWGSAGIMDGDTSKVWYTGIKATTFELSTGFGCASNK